MKTYVIHVSDAYDREKHMLNQLEGKDLDFSFITEGDKSDLNDAILNKYFKGKMSTVSNATSCAYKHLLAYDKISKGDDDIAMIVEDDIRFYSNFPMIKEILTEIEQRNIRNFMVSLEDSNLKYVPKSDRVKGKKIYQKNKGRLAGCYLMDKEGARNVLRYIEKEKTDLPIDWFHNVCANQNIINIFWSHPAIAVQGSLDGTIKSLIDSKKFGFFRIISFKMQRIYKKLLYTLR